MVIGTYFIVTDPYNLRPLLFGGSAPAQSNSQPVVTGENNTNTNGSIQGEVSDGFELSSAQVEALVSLGLDPAAVPSSISAEQEACFVGALGSARVSEIKAGAVPNAIEFLKAKSCI